MKDFVGDDDHAPDYIDRGGRDTRVCCQSCGRLLSEPAGIDTCRFWEGHAVITPGEYAAREPSFQDGYDEDHDNPDYMLCSCGVSPSQHDRAYARASQLAPLREWDRVRVTNPNHPHFGRAGELRTTVTVFFPWRVVFEDGMSGCVDDADVERLP